MNVLSHLPEWQRQGQAPWRGGGGGYSLPTSPKEEHFKINYKYSYRGYALIIGDFYFLLYTFLFFPKICTACTYQFYNQERTKLF